MNEVEDKWLGGTRLAKVMARAGLCSRREAENWIAAGRVAVNNKRVLTPVFTVTADDKVSVDGAPLVEKKATRLWLYHKPAGLVVTEKDPEGRPTIFEPLKKAGLPRVLTVGRLDINTEGLLLLTNDGGLKRVLELPATGWLRRYRVRAHGKVTQDQLDKLKAGTELGGVRYGPIEATLERVQGANVWLIVALREGKNREVKNVLATFGLAVNRLIRISYGPFQLGDIATGAVETVKSRVLRDQLGARLALEAGVDFDAPMPQDTTARGRKPDPRDPKSRVGGSLSRRRPAKAVPAPRGRTGAKGKPRPGPESPDKFGKRSKPLESERPTGRVHFDDGRPSEDFILRAKRPGRAPPGRGPQPAKSAPPRRPGPLGPSGKKRGR